MEKSDYFFDKTVIILAGKDETNSIKENLSQVGIFSETCTTQKFLLDKCKNFEGILAVFVNLDDSCPEFVSLATAKLLSELVPVVVMTHNNTQKKMAELHDIVVLENDNPVYALKRASQRHTTFSESKKLKNSIESLTSKVETMNMTFSQCFMAMKEKQDTCDVERGEIRKITEPVIQLTNLRENFIIKHVVLPSGKMMLKIWILPFMILVTSLYNSVAVPLINQLTSR